jgi:hypothetical protein
LRDWQEAGVWEKLHQHLLAKLQEQGALDWSVAVADSSAVRAVGAGKTGPGPVDRRKAGSKHHLLTDAAGVPLSVVVTGANRNDIIQLLPLLAALEPVKGQRGRPRKRPVAVQGDRAYDSQPHRLELHGVASSRFWLSAVCPMAVVWGRVAGLLSAPSLGCMRLAACAWLHALGCMRLAACAWLHALGCMRLRYERRADIHEALLRLACVLVSHDCLLRAFC